MSHAVRIYLLNRAFETWRWLCRSCLEELKAEGYEVKESKEPPHALACDGARCIEGRTR